MCDPVRNFLSDEAGAVALDWVALTGGLLLLVTALFANLRQGTATAAAALTHALSESAIPVQQEAGILPTFSVRRTVVPNVTTKDGGATPHIEPRPVETVPDKAQELVL